MSTDEEQLLNRGSNYSACQNYIPVCLEPYEKSKLKAIATKKLLFPKDSTLYPVMYKVHLELDKAKNLYFYVKRNNGTYLMLKHESKLGVIFKKFKGKDGYLKVYYHNDFLAKNKMLDYCFYFAQVVVVIYFLLFVYGYLLMHDYI